MKNNRMCSFANRNCSFYRQFDKKCSFHLLYMFLSSYNLLLPTLSLAFGKIMGFELFGDLIVYLTILKLGQGFVICFYGFLLVISVGTANKLHILITV